MDEPGNSDFIIFFVDSTLSHVAVPSGLTVSPGGADFLCVKILANLLASGTYLHCSKQFNQLALLALRIAFW
jgi:hypothetical protein